MDPGIDGPLDDAERYPTLSEEGRRMLQFMREHPRAPIYRNESGHRLTVENLERVRAFEREVEAAAVTNDPSEWEGAYLERCAAQVPFYRAYGRVLRRFAEAPTISRADLSRDVAQFVPDDVPVEELINFRTSGTTGHPLLLASHPRVAASYLAFHKKALRRFGIELRHGRGQVGVVLVGFQRRCFTYVSVTPTMEESGLAKINLHPDDWRDPADRAAYLDALVPEVFTGDPISLHELAVLPLRTRPRAILSTSMTLLPGLRERLEERFQCRVLDVYSMNEAGPIAVYDERLGGHVLLQHRMWVEVLDERGQAVGPGERGEVTLSGGFNFCMPLVRYRTGDFAALVQREGEWVLEGLEGRPPVRFRTGTGEWINNIEVTHALKQLPMPQFTLLQRADGSLRVELAPGAVGPDEVRGALEALFGPGTQMDFAALEPSSEKRVQYQSELRWDGGAASRY